jgi:hypothetical protein
MKEGISLGHVKGAAPVSIKMKINTSKAPAKHVRKVSIKILGKLLLANHA